jgi:hypothetical protein
MKKSIILILLSVAFIKISAQQPKIGIDPENRSWNYKFMTPNTTLNKSTVNSTSAQFSHTLPNGDKVYLLPQDHMPCIVPDASQYNYNMPVYKEEIMGTIPNASPPIQIIPREKLME